MQRYLLLFSSTYFFVAALFLLFSLAGCSLTPSVPSAEAMQEEQERLALNHLFESEPNPNLSPEQVVKIQVEALRNNDSKDRGIATTYKFASPANKQFTGPLKRFGLMVKSSYSLMLNFKRAKYDEMVIADNEASQRVSLIGEEGIVIIYRFTLSKQIDPSCLGCWMTDSVVIENITHLDQNQI